MFESIRAGVESLRYMQPRGVFVLPVDVPAAGADVWARLAACGGVAAPSYRGEHGHPIHIDWSLAEEVLGAPPGARLDELINGRLKYVGVDDVAVVANLNVPEDVREWERALTRG
jgi:CTP:molybdopterin cytidylyltransferase MocA